MTGKALVEQCGFWSRVGRCDRGSMYRSGTLLIPICESVIALVKEPGDSCVFSAMLKLVFFPVFLELTSW